MVFYNFINRFYTAIKNFFYLKQICFNQNWISIANSENGKYCSVICQSDNSNIAGAILVSSNYGKSFTLSLRLDIHWTQISMTSDGKYQIAIASSTTNKPSKIFISYNFGYSWVEITTLQSKNTIIKTINLNYCFWNSCCIVNNKIIIADTIKNIIICSDDYGFTWRLSSSPTNSVSCVHINNIDYQYYICHKNNQASYSLLYGYTWNLYTNKTNISTETIINICSFPMSSDINNNDRGYSICISKKYIFLCNNFTMEKINIPLPLENNEYFTSICSKGPICFVSTNKGNIYYSQTPNNFTKLIKSNYLLDISCISSCSTDLYICCKGGNVYKLNISNIAI